MENTLRVKEEIESTGKINCLNPCSNGKYSQSKEEINKGKITSRLNPCSNGKYSQSTKVDTYTVKVRVLILVLMENTLRGKCDYINPLNLSVLILVLMENTLRVFHLVLIKPFVVCLNPCSNGKYSQSLFFTFGSKSGAIVLILVLMENTLRGKSKSFWYE